MKTTKTTLLSFESALPCSAARPGLEGASWAVRWVSDEGRTIAELVLFEGRSRLSEAERALVMMVADDVATRIVASPLSDVGPQTPSKEIRAQLRALEHGTRFGSFEARHCL
jgi:hypothetical protein